MVEYWWVFTAVGVASSALSFLPRLRAAGLGMLLAFAAMALTFVGLVLS
jgi:hypothetical protein